MEKPKAAGAGVRATLPQRRLEHVAASGSFPKELLSGSAGDLELIALRSVGACSGPGLTAQRDRAALHSVTSVPWEFGMSCCKPCV